MKLLRVSFTCRGTPRIANRVFKRVRDACADYGDGLIDDADMDKAFKLCCDVDHLVLNYGD